MASTREYVEFVAGQLSGAGAITYRKLFGEYGLLLFCVMRLPQGGLRSAYTAGRFALCHCRGAFFSRPYRNAIYI